MTADDQRAAAVERLKGKRAFQQSLVAYVLINAVLVGIWALGDRGFFWPVWVIGFWGIGLAFQGYSAYGRREITEDDIQKEIQRD
jgi:2TM domain-containing protein